MKTYPFDYNIYPDNSPEAFKRVCGKIEAHFTDLKKENLLVDVDGTTIQRYTRQGKEIVIFDDYDIGAVFAQSEINLEGIMA